MALPLPPIAEEEDEACIFARRDGNSDDSTCSLASDYTPQRSLSSYPLHRQEEPSHRRRDGVIRSKSDPLPTIPLRERSSWSRRLVASDPSLLLQEQSRWTSGGNPSQPQHMLSPPSRPSTESSSWDLPVQAQPALPQQQKVDRPPVLRRRRISSEIKKQPHQKTAEPEIPSLHEMIKSVALDRMAQEAAAAATNTTQSTKKAPPKSPGQTTSPLLLAMMEDNQNQHKEQHQLLRNNSS